MESSVKERLKLFLQIEKIKQTDFCQAIGVSTGFISSMRESIQPDKLKNIAINYPKLDIGWLMVGEGNMIKNNVGGSSFHTVNTGTAKNIVNGRADIVEYGSDRVLPENMEMVELNNKIKLLEQEVVHLNKLLEEKDKMLSYFLLKKD